jgi:hypothetical protein
LYSNLIDKGYFTTLRTASYIWTGSQSPLEGQRDAVGLHTEGGTAHE